MTSHLLAIDPGYDRCGVAIFSIEKNTTTRTNDLLFSACIETNKTDTQAIRLLHIYTEIETLLTKWDIVHVAIETIFFSINKKTAVKVAEARGMLLLLAAQHNLSIIELSPQEVKLAVTGVGNANKAQVKKMIELLYKETKKMKLDDELDAIALGLGALAKLQFGARTRK